MFDVLTVQARYPVCIHGSVQRRRHADNKFGEVQYQIQGRPYHKTRVIKRDRKFGSNNFTESKGMSRGATNVSTSKPR